MIDLKKLAEYARRSGALVPAQLSPMFEPENWVAAEAGLVLAWLENWHWIDEEVQQMLAEHLEFEHSNELHAAIQNQGLKLALTWIHQHGELPLAVDALHRSAVSEAGQQ